MVRQISHSRAPCPCIGDLRSVRCVLHRCSRHRATPWSRAHARRRGLRPRARQHCPAFLPCHGERCAGCTLGHRALADDSDARTLRRGERDAESDSRDRRNAPRLGSASDMVGHGDGRHRAHSCTLDRRRIRTSHNWRECLGGASRGGRRRLARHVSERHLRRTRWASLSALCRCAAGARDSTIALVCNARRVDRGGWRRRALCTTR